VWVRVIIRYSDAGRCCRTVRSNWLLRLVLVTKYWDERADYTDWCCETSETSSSKHVCTGIEVRVY
jgi:hypothetical protein